MKCLLLGEGPTDLGFRETYPKQGIRKGAMTHVIDALAAAKGVTDIEYELLTRVEVAKGIKDTKRAISSRPKNVDNELLSFFRSAWYLGAKIANEPEAFSVYFHDADHTNSGSADTALQMERTMSIGYQASGCDTGVPMVPNPRSEAWLLAYFQKGLPGQTEYNKAERFEGLPANDASPKSAKKLLQTAVGAESESDVYQVVMDCINEIDWTRVVMPSYNRFRNRLESVLDTLSPAHAPERALD